MKITGIEPKRRGLSAVYIDGEYAMHLDTVTLLEKGINPGAQLNDEQLKVLIESCEARRAREKALNLISYRDHSKKELQTKIKRTCSPQAAEQAANRLEELGLINDEQFARRYARQLADIKKMAPRAIMQKLYEKGIERDLAEVILEETEIDTRQNAADVLSRKYPKAASDEKVKRRAVACLQRMGYSWSDIQAALRMHNADEEIEDDY